jgi:serine/threonine-protein kinase
MIVTAIGLADPSHPRYQGDAAKVASDARADARTQLVAKALGLLVDRESLARHYDVLSDRLLAKNAAFVGEVVRESEPRTGSDGFVWTAAEAVVDVKALQKSLNRMTRDERVQLIRASGDPRIVLRVRVRDADRPDASPRAAPAAENLLKERIRSFGFRTFSDDPPGKGGRADFVVTADATVRTISTRLEASGITVTKYAVASMSVKAVDSASGEEIYFNTALPKGTGSYASEDEALAALGRRIADEFSRDLFLQHVEVRPRRIVLVVSQWPDAHADALGRELVALPGIIASRPRADGQARSFDLDVAAPGAASDVVAKDVIAPLNAKLGTSCLALGASAGDRVDVTFDRRCSEPAILARLETHPPAGLYQAPPARKSALVANPETLRKLSL